MPETLWLVVASFLVLLMQGGFLLLEAGSVRTKNAVNVAQKNISDLTICWVAFSLIGFTVMFGLPSPILFDPILTEVSIPSKNGMPNGAHPLVHFVYQLGFCGATATMISGSVAERMRFVPYLGVTGLVALLIYPIVGWGVWGNHFIDNRSAWLADLGFIDFAGATVIHSLGAWVALIACWQIKPRRGRFSADGKVQKIHGHSAVLSTCGTLLLLIGWVGFNLGGLSPAHEHFGRAFINTLTGACFGALSGMMIGWFLDGGVFNPGRTCNGMIAGLVSVTACAAWVLPIYAVLIATIGGALSQLLAYWLLHHLKIDDPLDVVATHGGAGIWGTLAIAGFVEPEYLSLHSRWHQLGIQIAGAIGIGLYATSMTFVVLSFVKRFMPLRVTESEEKLGLNYIEHGIQLNAQRLKAALEDKFEHNQSSLVPSQEPTQSSLRLPSPPSNHFKLPSTSLWDEQDDDSEVAATLQKLLGQYETAQSHIGQQAKRFKDFAYTSSDFFWETNQNLQMIFLSPQFNHLADKPLRDFYGKNLWDLLAFDKAMQSKLHKLTQKRLPWPKFESHNAPAEQEA